MSSISKVHAMRDRTGGARPCRGTNRRRLFIFVKEPHPGRVKTRLGAGIGHIGAAWWFRRQCARLLRKLDDVRWETWIAVSPDREGLMSRIWPSHFPKWVQGRGDLGARMGRVLQTAPPGPVVIIGADIPDIAAADIEAAFRALGDHDVVVGPAPDGGYWLIGMARRRRIPATLFRGVRWSTNNALADTLASLPGMRVARLRMLNDVDEVADLT
jgi:rSAM/selenodomain-associated transferase 1